MPVTTSTDSSLPSEDDNDVVLIQSAFELLDTIEGVATPEGLHPIQTAFLEGAALQCGICTPGFIISSKALLEAEPEPSEGRIRLWLAGNLCRCTGYDKIVKAVMDVAGTLEE